MEISAHSGTLAKFAFLGIPCLHPIVLIHVGLVYGWIGFWSMFLGTALITGLGLTKTGYGERFENAGQGIIRKSVGGMLIAFGMVVSPYEGLFVLRSWAITLVVILLLARIITRD